MRPNNSLIMSAASVAASQNSSAVWAVDIVRVSAQAVVTGTPTGTLQLQFSNDQAVGKPANQYAPTSWSNLGSAVTVAAAGVFVIPLTECSYEYLRVQYIDGSSGAGVGTCTIRLKSMGL